MAVVSCSVGGGICARANGSRDVSQLLLAIPAHETRLAGRPSGRQHNRWLTDDVTASLDDTRQLTLGSFAKAGVVGFVRHDHVDPGDTSEPAHQIEVGGPQAARIRRPIRHRNHDVGERKIGLPVDEQAPEHVLVHRPARRHAAFVAEKREAEEARLMDQTLAAAIRPALDRAADRTGIARSA